MRLGDSFLKFLSAGNQEKLMISGRSETFASGEVLLAEGEVRRAIFLIERGCVRIERSHMGFNVEVSRLQAGEIFGEMSFVESYAASASVISDDEVEVLVFDESGVNSLMEADPTFTGQFYRSLAEVISRRLREVTARSVSEFAWGADSEKSNDRKDWGGGSPLRDQKIDLILDTEEKA